VSNHSGQGLDGPQMALHEVGLHWASPSAPAARRTRTGEEHEHRRKHHQHQPGRPGGPDRLRVAVLRDRRGHLRKARGFKWWPVFLASFFLGPVGWALALLGIALLDRQPAKPDR
jgi:hypothetical protein